MEKTKKSGFSSYFATPLMMVVFYTLASLFFLIVFKDISTVIFFIILAFFFIISMIIYSLVPFKIKNIIRIINIFLISSLLFGLACILGKQNFQIEGFFFFIF